MADLHLIRPDAGSVQSVSGRGDVRFVFDFPPGEAVFSREGNDLLLSFDDGAVLRLQDFYLVSSAESVPSFEVDGAEITGKDFLLSMNGADLMPAAGNAREAWKGNGNRFHDYQDATLSGSVTLAGLDRLEGPDVDWEAEASSPPAEGLAAGSFVDVDHGVTVSSQGSLTVHESGLAGGSSPGVKPTTASGSLVISAPDGVAAIAIGGTTVYENGALTGRTVSTDEGFLTATGFNAATGELTYDYNLTAGTTEHDTAATDAQFSRVLAVTVTDADGSVGEGVITVTIVDDEPSTTDITHELHEGDTSPAVGYVLDTDSVTGVVVTGADDGEGASFAWEANQNGKYGTITMNADGSYSYRLDHDNAKVKALTTGETLSEEFKYAYADADGDTVAGSVNVIIHGKNNGVTVTPGASPAVDDFGLLTGSFLIMAPDGVDTIVIDGVTVYDGVPIGEDGITVSTDKGTLKVTGFDTVTGEVKYSYLAEPFSFDVTVTDADGSEGTCSITVTNGDDGADGTSSATAGLTFALPAGEAEGVASLAMSTEDDASALSGSLADAGEGGGQNGGGADEPASFHAPAGSGALESCLARFEAPDHAVSDGEEMLFAGSGDGLSDGAAPVGLSGEAEGHGSGLMAEALADGAARGLAAGMEGTLSLDALLGSDSGGRSAEALMPDSDALSLTGMDRLDGEDGADGAGRETLLSDASFWSVPSGDACDVAGDLSLETAFMPVENTSADDAAAQQAFLLQNGSG